jgi:hypothetical protein
MGPKPRTVEQRIDWIAARAHGIVSVADLSSAGVTRREIRRRVEKGLLIREHRGVYRVGGAARTFRAIYMAAVKACGPGAVLCGRAAAYLQSLLPKCRKPPPPEVWCPTERRVTGVKTRRAKALDRRERMTFDGIPCTTMPRTLVDLAAVLDEQELARACHEADVKYRTKPRHVDAVLARHPRAPGRKNLRRILHGDVHITLSALERAFLELLREEGLPLPITNRVASGRYVDCRWPDRDVTVELISYRYHGTRHSWERDNRRQREARARRDDFRTYTWDDVTKYRRATKDELRLMLAP